VNDLLKEISECNCCASHLPLGARPVLRAQSRARILIIGQAPGTRVHRSGIPWNDPSGDTLRKWLQVDEETFYNSGIFAIIPMGFCYPGKGKSGDLPPRWECAPLWHSKLWQSMPHIGLCLLIGQYSQRYYLKNKMKENLTQTVRSYSSYLPLYFPLIHPSPRNRIWQKKNPWFEAEILPALRDEVKKYIPHYRGQG
jgi:uracil-DNA glycosylase